MTKVTKLIGYEMNEDEIEKFEDLRKDIPFMSAEDIDRNIKYCEMMIRIGKQKEFYEAVKTYLTNILVMNF